MNTFRELIEAKFAFYDKTTLYRELPKSKGKFFNWDKDGKWTIDDKAGDYGFKAVNDILNYMSWNYNTKTSITVALKDLEAGKFDDNEVEER